MLGTVARAGSVLDLFCDETPEWGPSAVARELSIAKSQAHELLSSLAAIGLLRRSASGRYRLGWRALTLGRGALRTELPATGLRLVRALGASFEEPVQLVGIDRERLTLIAERRGKSAAAARIPDVLETQHIYCSAAGKCLLAGVTQDRWEALLGTQPLRSLATGAIIDRARLEDELEAIRVDRVAIDRGDAAAGLCSAAAPIEAAANEVVAAVAVWTTEERWSRIGQEIAKAVAGAGRRMSQSMRLAAEMAPVAV